MKVSLICTVFNEESSIGDFLTSVIAMSTLPDEMIIVDAGSTDRTLNIIISYAKHAPFPIKVIVEKGCNIAKGRNIAISNTTNDLIAVTDAGCRVDINWLMEISKPLSEPTVDVVSGWFEPDSRSFFELITCNATYPDLKKVDPNTFLPSSRSIAFRKAAWKSVNGYPEWLTLTAEDTLFDVCLKNADCNFVFAPKAVVYWRPRRNLSALLRQYYLYGFGDGEIRGFKNGYYYKMTIKVIIVLIGTVLTITLTNNMFFILLFLILSLIFVYGRNLKNSFSVYMLLSSCLVFMTDIFRLLGWLKGRSKYLGTKRSLQMRN